MSKENAIELLKKGADVSNFGDPVEWQKKERIEHNGNGFIQQTAIDYDMNYSEVEIIYNRYYSEGLFYDKLEEYIKDRANRNN